MQQSVFSNDTGNYQDLRDCLIVPRGPPTHADACHWKEGQIVGVRFHVSNCT